MHLCIDIGNSNAVIGLRDTQWQHTWRMPTGSVRSQGFKLDFTARWMETRIAFERVSKITVSSVVPDLTLQYCTFFAGMFGAPLQIIGPEHYDLIGIKTPHPEEIGTDLVANARAALDLVHAPVLITDFGTALTFLAVSEHGEILGASIAPGIETALGSLRSSTAQLPVAGLKVPGTVAGRNTEEAIQSGVVLGYLGLVKHLINTYQEWSDNPLTTIATGGLINPLPEYHALFAHVVPTLTLDGIFVIGEKIHA